MTTLPHHLRWLLLLLAFFGINASSSIASELPDIGNTANNLLSFEEEQRLGKEFMRSIRQNLSLVDDPVSNNYIQSLGNRLASQIEGVRPNFQFFLVDDPSINAFAGPAGYIGIHTGLIQTTKSEGELASVIAHEIAHVTQRHLVRQFESRSNMSMTTMAALIAAVLLGRGNPEVSEAVLASTVASNIEQQLSFSRAHEQEADRVGIKLLANAGYNTHSMADFFEALQTSNRFNETGLPEFILTHPVTSTRIADTRNRASQLANQQKTSNPPMSYNLFIARINAYAAQEPSAEKSSSQTAKANIPHKDDYPGRYKHVLDLLKLQKFETAQKEINALIQDDKLRIPYIITKADIETSSNNIEAALNTLARALILYPQNQTLSYYYAESLLRANKAKNAMSVLRNFIRNKKAVDPRMYKVYADAAEVANFQSEAYEAMADYHYLLGQSHTALQNLEQAIKQSDADAYQKLRLEARVEQLKQEMLMDKADLEK